VVTSIKRVTDIMGEISSASTEQSLGVAQVGEAVGQMDQATQQNAALVEQMAAAASSLKSQANELVAAVAVFKLGANDQSAAPKAQVRSKLPPSKPFKGNERRADAAAPPKPAAARSPKPQMTARVQAPAAPAAPVAAKKAPPPVLTVKTQPKPAPAGGDEEWETF